jgi:ABC-2 type transport system ATP-binding protein
MSAPPAVVQVENVSKRFVIHKDKSLKERVVNFGRSQRHKDDFWALRDISLEIVAGSTVGLVGHNGSGKSTLLKLVGGIMQPTSGSIRRRGRLAALIELGAGFHPDLTGRENVYLNCAILGISRAQTARQFDAIVDFSGIEQFIDTQVKFYSSGMYIRLAFAVAVHVDPDLLLVDEVLSVGDEPFQRKCMDRIRSFQNDGRTIVIVSHALEQVAELCDRAVVLEHGRILADDEPRAALRRLRADFEVTRQEERDRERTSGMGQRASEAEVVAVRIGQGGPGGSYHHQPGADIDIEVEIVAAETISKGIIGIGIDLPGGQVLFGTNTKLMGLQVPSFIGQKFFRFSLPDVRLAEGQYSVHAAIAEESGVEIHRLPDAATIEVDALGESVGVLYTRPVFTAL